MVRGIFITCEVEHQGDIDTYRSIIIENGGTVDKVDWQEDDDCVIVYHCENKEVKSKIQNQLENGI